MAVTSISLPSPLSLVCTGYGCYINLSPLPPVFGLHWVWLLHQSLSPPPCLWSALGMAVTSISLPSPLSLVCTGYGCYINLSPLPPVFGLHWVWLLHQSLSPPPCLWSALGMAVTSISLPSHLSLVCTGMAVTSISLPSHLSLVCTGYGCYINLSPSFVTPTPLALALNVNIQIHRQCWVRRYTFIAYSVFYLRCLEGFVEGFFLFFSCNLLFCYCQVYQD